MEELRTKASNYLMKEINELHNQSYLPLTDQQSQRWKFLEVEAKVSYEKYLSLFQI